MLVIFSIQLQHNPRPRQLPRVILVEARPQRIFRVRNALRAEQLLGLRGLWVGHAVARRDGAHERL